jgi:hypothetical protein
LIVGTGLVSFQQPIFMPNQPSPTAEWNVAEPKLEPRRVSKRIHVALPIRVTYWDNDKKPGLEMSCTYDISENGARIGNLSCKRSGRNRRSSNVDVPKRFLLSEKQFEDTLHFEVHA